MYTEDFALRGLILCEVFLLPKYKERKRKPGGDQYVYGIDYGDGFINVYLSPHLPSCIL